MSFFFHICTRCFVVALLIVMCDCWGKHQNCSHRSGDGEVRPHIWLRWRMWLQKSTAYAYMSALHRSLRASAMWLQQQLNSCNCTFKAPYTPWVWGCVHAHACVCMCVCPLVCSYYMLAYFRTPLQLQEFTWTRNPVLLEESVWLFQEDRRTTEGLSENTVWCILELQEAQATDITDGTMWLFLFYRYELERLGLQENTIYYRCFCYLQTVIKD